MLYKKRKLVQISNKFFQGNKLLYEWCKINKIKVLGFTRTTFHELKKFSDESKTRSETRYVYNYNDLSYQEFSKLKDSSSVYMTDWIDISSPRYPDELEPKPKKLLQRLLDWFHKFISKCYTREKES